MTAPLDWLREPDIRGVDLDDAARIDRHLAVLARKPMIREVFVECHHAMRALDREHLTGAGPTVEIGAGWMPREMFPRAVPDEVLSRYDVNGRTPVECVIGERADAETTDLHRSE